MVPSAVELGETVRRRSSAQWLVRALVLVAVGLGLAASAPSAGAAADGEGDRPVIRVGTEGNYPPFTYKDTETGDLTGYDVEVIEAVADEVGWDLEFVEAPFDALFPALDSERIDVIANQVTINPDREAQYLFTEPYTYSRRRHRHGRRHRRHRLARRPRGEDHGAVGDEQLGAGGS